MPHTSLLCSILTGDWIRIQNKLSFSLSAMTPASLVCFTCCCILISDVKYVIHMSWSLETVEITERQVVCWCWFIGWVATTQMFTVLWHSSSVSYKNSGSITEQVIYACVIKIDCQNSFPAVIPLSVILRWIHELRKPLQYRIHVTFKWLI